MNAVRVPWSHASFLAYFDGRRRTALVLPPRRLRLDRDRARRARVHRARRPPPALELGRARGLGPPPGDDPFRREVGRRPVPGLLPAGVLLFQFFGFGASE